MPPDRPPKRARLNEPDRQVAHPEHAVSHFLDGDPKAGLLCTVRVAGDRGRRIAEQGHVEQVGHAHLGGAEPVPPGGDESAPARALAVRGRHHLVEVAEEAGDAGGLKDTTDDLRPVLEGADGSRTPRFAGDDPGPAERQAGRDQPCAVGSHPHHQVRVTEARALPGLLDIGIKPDAHQAPRHLVGELGVVAGRDPEAADRQARHLGMAENAVLPEGRGERGGHGRAVELGAQVVDQDDRGDLTQLGGDAFAPFLVVTSFGHDAGPGAREDRGDRVDHQRGAGAGRGFLDQVQRGRPVDHAPQETEQQERHCMGTLSLAGEGEVSQQVLADERARRSDLGRGRPGRDVRYSEPWRRDVEQPRIGMVARHGDQRAASTEDRRVHDTGQHGQCRVGRGKDRLDHGQGWWRRDLLALGVHAHPAGEPRQHVAEPLLIEGRGDGTALVVGHDPCGLARQPKEPRAAVRDHEQVPDLLVRPRQIALVGAECRNPVARALVVEWPVLSDLHDCFRLYDVVRRRDRAGHGLRAVAQQQVVEVLAFHGRYRDGDVAPLCAQTAGSGLGRPQAGAGCVVVSEDHDAPGSRRQFDLLEPRSGQGGPYRQIGTGGHRREPGLDPLGQRQPVAVTDGREPHGPAGNAAEHLLRLVERRLADAAVRVCREPRPVQPDDVAVPVPDLADERRVAGLRLVMRQIGVKQQIGLGRDGQTAAREVVGGRRARERFGRGQDVDNLKAGVPLGWRRRRWRLPHWRARGDARDLCGPRDQSAALKPGRRLDGADRPASLITVEVDPVAGMGPAQGNDAGAGVPGCIAPDIGEPPLVAGAAAAREELRHPVLGALAQTLDDQVEIKTRRLGFGRESVVEVKQGSPAPARPA